MTQTDPSDPHEQTPMPAPAPAPACLSEWEQWSLGEYRLSIFAGPEPQPATELLGVYVNSATFPAPGGDVTLYGAYLEPLVGTAELLAMPEWYSDEPPGELPDLRTVRRQAMERARLVLLGMVAGVDAWLADNTAEG